MENNEPISQLRLVLRELDAIKSMIEGLDRRVTTAVEHLDRRITTHVEIDERTDVQLANRLAKIQGALAVLAVLIPIIAGIMIHFMH